MAATLVVIFHTIIHLNARNLDSGIPYSLAIGRSGVDIFFVISGFIMVYVTTDSFQKKGSGLDFMIKRSIRIIPVYWFYTLVMAGLLVLSPQNFSGGKSLQPDHLFASLAFIAWPSNTGDLKPVLQAGWTLNFEMYFYLVVALLLRFPSKHYFSLLSTFFIGSIFLGLLFPGLPAPLKVLTSPLLLEFLMGTLAGILFLSLSKIPYPGLITLSGFVLLIIASIVLGDTTALRWLKWGAPGFLIVLGSAFLERQSSFRIPRLLITLGDSSYSLYLTHIFSINLLGFFWHRFIGDYYTLFCAAAIIGSIVAGQIAYLIIEKPVTNWLSKKYRNSDFHRRVTPNKSR